MVSSKRLSAIKLWTKLSASLPAGSEPQQEIQTLITKLASNTPQKQVPSQPEQGQQEKVSNLTISVQVGLAPELLKSTSPGDTVFIYAQALSGPKMPLAIVRKQVSDLTLTVSLNDTMAMMPNMKLSNFANVKLLARISKSGNAMTQLGDLIGFIESVALTDKETHHIMISGPVK